MTRLLFIIMVSAFLFMSAGPLGAEEKKPEGTIEDGTGFSMFGTESIKGFDESKVEKDPVCDRSKRPKIHKV